MPEVTLTSTTPKPTLEQLQTRIRHLEASLAELDEGDPLRSLQEKWHRELTADAEALARGIEPVDE